MNETTNPQLHEIITLTETLPDSPAYQSGDHSDGREAFSYLARWLGHYAAQFDASRGFHVNRCALYWAGYDIADNFDGKAFVETCRDVKSPMRDLAQTLDTDLQIFELDPFNHAPVGADALALAAGYGMMAIEEPTQLFCMASFGQGVEAKAAQALASLQTETDFDGVDFFKNHCGLDHAAMFGAVIAACLKGIPVICEGQGAKLAVEILARQTGRRPANILHVDDFNLPLSTSMTGAAMITTAITIKAIFAASDKSPCGKIKAAA